MGSAHGKQLVLRIGLVVAVVVLVIGGIQKYRSRLSPQNDVASPQATGLYVNPERLDFGEVWEDDHFAWLLPIENRSDADISIERFYNSCVCTEINPRSLVIPAGSSRDIRLTIDLMTEKVYDRPEDAVRDFAIRVSAVVMGPEGGEKNQDWEVRGHVKRAIKFEQSAIDFGMHSERAQPLPARRIAVKSFAPLDSLAVSGSLSCFPVRVTRRPNDPSWFDLEIVPKVGLPVEPYKFDLSVVPIQAGGRRLAAKKLPVVAWVVPDLQGSPPEINFGAVPVGQTAAATITLSSLTGQAFTVERWHCTNDRVTVEREAAGAGNPAFRVKWPRVTSSGQQQAEVVFRITTGGKEGASIKVPVRCLGISEDNANAHGTATSTDPNE